MTRMLTLRGWSFALHRADLTTLLMTVSASLLLALMDLSVSFPQRHWTMPSGHAMDYPVPDRSSRRDMNLMDLSVKHPWFFIIFMISACETFQESGALKVLNDSM
jgi:hypothetical protein